MTFPLLVEVILAYEELTTVVPPTAESTIHSSPHSQLIPNKMVVDDNTLTTRLLSTDNHPSTTLSLVETPEIKNACSTSKLPHPVIFHFMRHGEAYHNVGKDRERFKLLDPKLTPNGKWQCEQVRTLLPAKSNIKILLCSPMTRTIETTLIAFKDVIESGNVRKPAAYAELREWGSGQCSTGSPLSELEAKFGQHIDFNLLMPPDWEINTEIKGNKLRAKTVKNRLFVLARSVQDDVRSGKLDILEGVPYEIAIVSHGSFLETMLEVELGGCRSNRKQFDYFHNANMKSFSFDTIDGPGGIRHELTQTKESRDRPLSSGHIEPSKKNITAPDSTTKAD